MGIGLAPGQDGETKSRKALFGAFSGWARNCQGGILHVFEGLPLDTTAVASAIFFFGTDQAIEIYIIDARRRRGVTQRQADRPMEVAVLASSGFHCCWRAVVWCSAHCQMTEEVLGWPGLGIPRLFAVCAGRCCSLV